MDGFLSCVLYFHTDFLVSYLRYNVGVWQGAAEYAHLVISLQYK